MKPVLGMHWYELTERKLPVPSHPWALLQLLEATSAAMAADSGA